MSVTLLYGDCLTLMHGITGVDAVVTDPPYGMGWKFTGQGSGKNAQGGKHSITKGCRIVDDNKPFNPTPWLGFPIVVLWGMQHFLHLLCPGSTLVWVKKYPNAYGTFLSDGDLAWMKGGCGVYISETINPASFQSEKCHPTQKPVGLMKWCLEKAKVPVGATVLDPFMGSGSTGVACVETGRNFIGVECDEGYFKTAVARIEAAERKMEGYLFPVPTIPSPIPTLL